MAQPSFTGREHPVVDVNLRLCFIDEYGAGSSATAFALGYRVFLLKA
jgi:hypothetical protein